jgi:hypothetical protein
VGDFDINVVLGPLLGLELTPLHLALDRVLGLAEPSFELGVDHCIDCSEVGVIGVGRAVYGCCEVRGLFLPEESTNDYIPATTVNSVDLPI